MSCGPTQQLVERTNLSPASPLKVSPQTSSTPVRKRGRCRFGMGNKRVLAGGWVLRRLFSRPKRRAQSSPEADPHQLEAPARSLPRTITWSTESLPVRRGPGERGAHKSLSDNELGAGPFTKATGGLCAGQSSASGGRCHSGGSLLDRLESRHSRFAGNPGLPCSVGRAGYGRGAEPSLLRGGGSWDRFWHAVETYKHSGEKRHSRNFLDQWSRNSDTELIEKRRLISERGAALFAGDA